MFLNETNKENINDKIEYIYSIRENKLKKRNDDIYTKEENKR